jgi:iron(III) transport system substrate-binding protein
MTLLKKLFLVLAGAAMLSAGLILAAGGVRGAGENAVNLYSARHYSSDAALYEAFTAKTGIKVNLIEGGDEQIVERVRGEGANSPADVILLVDGGRLWQADRLNLFQPLRSPELEARIPASLRHGAGHWFGLSTRARVLLYRKGIPDAGQLTGFRDLADPRWRGRVCMRSSGNIYNLSLLAALIERWGETEAQAWAAAVAANFARPPQGGDTDQIRAVAAGQCDVTVANTYYLVRLLRSAKPEDQAAMAGVGVVWPDQNGPGAHVNVAGGGVARHAPNPAAARRFLEFLASDEGQRHFASANNEYPVVAMALDNPALQALGEFRADPLSIEVVGRNQPRAQQIFDRAGWR